MFQRFRYLNKSELGDDNPFKHYSIELHDQFAKYTHQAIRSPSRILALDLDDTLLDLKTSIRFKKTSIKNYLQIKELLRIANKQNIAVVIITARYLHTQVKKKVNCISVLRTLARLGIHHFSEIFFTNNTCKRSALEHLYAQHFRPSWFNCRSLRHKVCLVDDRIQNLLAPSQAGFDTIHCDASNDYLVEMYQFITGRRLIDVPVYHDRESEDENAFSLFQ
jgi:hypothetical protein